MSNDRQSALGGCSGAGKSTIGAPLAARLEVDFLDLEIYISMPIRKIETMRPAAAAVEEIVAALSEENE